LGRHIELIGTEISRSRARSYSAGASLAFSGDAEKLLKKKIS
jgi:hypothetical protein